MKQNTKCRLHQKHQHLLGFFANNIDKVLTSVIRKKEGSKNNALSMTP